MSKTRVVLAEDHTVVAEGLVKLLADVCELVAVVHDGRELVSAVTAFRPDVIVTDISMPLLNGLEAIREIRLQHPQARIIVLTMHRDTQMAVDAFRAGVSGYLLKVSPAAELINAIQEVAQGRSYITSLLAKNLITVLIEAADPSRDSGSPLTPRQRQVLQLIAEGKTMKEVASIMNISPKTVESHKYELMQVLGVRNTAELIQYAVRAKVVGE
jgi:DNA-binding NarL/FixJ family response regulator